MTVYFSVIDESGRVLRSGSCPENLVEMQARPGERAIQTEIQMRDGRHYLKDGEWRSHGPRSNPWEVFDVAQEIWIDPRSEEEKAAHLEDRRQVARQKLNDMIAEARSALVTDLPGQDMIYLAKETEARAWLQSVEPQLEDYPLLSAEVGLTAPDADQLAQLWLNLGALWRQMAAQLEHRRLSAGQALSSATSIEELEAVLAVTN